MEKKIGTCELGDVYWDENQEVETLKYSTTGTNEVRVQGKKHDGLVRMKSGMGATGFDHISPPERIGLLAKVLDRWAQKRTFVSDPDNRPWKKEAMGFLLDIGAALHWSGNRAGLVAAINEILGRFREDNYLDRADAVISECPVDAVSYQLLLKPDEACFVLEHPDWGVAWFKQEIKANGSSE